MTHNQDETKEFGSLNQRPADEAGDIAESVPHDAVFGIITENGPNYRNV